MAERPMRHETSRLIIRDFEMNDWPAVHRYGSDLEIMKYATYHANTETDTKNYVQRAMTDAKLSPRTNYDRAVTLRDDPNTLIGGCGLSLENEDNSVWRLGYCYHSDYWGQGSGIGRRVHEENIHGYG